ncbi:transporter associated domain-containing protein [Granulosicoccaceae sp. 1_MG-2023]|nr:transporter associated domain-containing protein [Granulosicoccaceae sp. 1_MG-2023]
MSEEQLQENPPRSFMDRIAQAFGAEPRDEAGLLEILHSATERKIVDTDAMAMIEGVFEVAGMQVRDIVIPRAQMVVVERDAPLEEILPVIIESGHSRFPVIDEDRDDIVGVLLAKDLLRFTACGEENQFNIEDVMRPPVFAPESKRLNVLLKEFRISRNHMAIVIDEYGGVAGLVTIEDVLEQIVGEIDDEHDGEEDVNIRSHGDGRYSVRALTEIDEFNEVLGADLSDEEYDTIGGLVMHEVGHMPNNGEVVEFDRFRFRVVSADSRRIHLLQVTMREPDDDDDFDDE